MRFRPALRIGAALICGSTLLGVAAGAANATTLFSQAWYTSANYRASGDFVPAAGTVVHIGGEGGSGGSASYWYSSLVTTSGSSIVFSSYSYPADGQHYYDNRTAVVGPSPTKSYYLRWHGQDGGLNNGYYAPDQFVIAFK